MNFLERTTRFLRGNDPDAPSNWQRPRPVAKDYLWILLSICLVAALCYFATLSAGH